AVVVLGVVASDPIEAVIEVRNAGYLCSEDQIKGVICQGLLHRVCVRCAKATPIDNELIASIPPTLRPKGATKYRIGRGCKACDQTTYSGTVGVQSFLFIDETVSHLIDENADYQEIVKYAHGKGLRSLYEDGLSKAFSGLTTLEQLFKLVRTIPDAYVKLEMTSCPWPPSETEVIAVEEDYFVRDGGASTVNQKPDARRDSAVFRGVREGATLDGSEPLFSVSKVGKVREKPLLLVVEDDPDQRDILEIVFRSANYDVDLVADGSEALTYLEKELPDLIVSDVMMPKVDGHELVRKVKSHSTWKQIPVMVLTVLEDAEKEYDLLNSGADDYCEKTVQRKILLKRIEKLIQRNSIGAKK
ncbi:MAG: response regulator, partial [Bdellovibrionales bacterium]|nr:response regulator [Bdellovibrionales bacterium]